MVLDKKHQHEINEYQKNVRRQALQIQAAACELYPPKLDRQDPKKKSMTEYFPQLLSQSLLKIWLRKALG